MRRNNSLEKRKGMERTQILLEPQLRRKIEEIAHQEKQSFSSMVREMLKEELRARKRRRLEEAAKELLQDYTTNQELTAFNALDGEDFNA